MQPIKRNNRGFKLNISTESEISFYSVPFPIVWEGTLNENSIKIVQREYSNNPLAFDFLQFPLEYQYKEKVIEAIDTDLKVILD